MTSFVKRFFQNFARIPINMERQVDRERREIERGVVATVARGNISLQNGDYITPKDWAWYRRNSQSFFLLKNRNGNL